MDNEVPLLERVREYTGWVEDKLDTLSEPIKPYVPSVSSWKPKNKELLCPKVS
jgi:hypothetical protein